MDDEFLVQCSNFDTVVILKAAMVNAIAHLEHCSSRRERQELRRFILDCAGRINGLLRTCKPQNAEQKPDIGEYTMPDEHELKRFANAND